MQILVTKEKVTPETLRQLCEAWFGDMVKVVVDIGVKRIALGGDLHADGEVLLLGSGSRQCDCWGANIYPRLAPEKRIEYTALINIRPKQSNPSMEILDEGIRARVRTLIEQLVIAPGEKLV